MTENGEIIRLEFNVNQLVIKRTFGTCNKQCGALEKNYLKTTIPGISFTIQASLFVHTIVAVIFLSRKSDSQTVVHHRNGISWDNRVHNLKWATERENNQYANGMPVQVIEQGSNKICNYLSMREMVKQYKLVFIPSQSFEHEGKKYLVIYLQTFSIFILVNNFNYLSQS